MKNIDFSANFTHPLNYLCLLEEKLLRKIVKSCRNEIKEFFGYIDEHTEMKYNLSNLKICMGHYGGDEEWLKYLERDRLPQLSNLLRIERNGFDFFPNDQDMLDQKNGYLGYIWMSFDWFSIITNLMYKYENVYADISYIVHNPSIYPLLKHALLKKELKDKIIYGTDFFVVRNHKSESNYWQRQWLILLKMSLT
ncbi:MAG: hypothetical protein IPP06_07760 [Saprospiraceae bacterium]|nr:hypothetical protein [Candidatus Vicinibacter affinis]